MPLYESTFVARHDMSAQQVESLTATFTDIVKKNGGEITKTEYWGLRTLAYRIRKSRKGHYVFFNLDAPSDAVREFERNMRLNEDVLRYLTVAVDELDPNPSPMMQARAARDDRSRRGGGGARARAAVPAMAKTVSGPADETKAAPAKKAKAESGAESGPADETKAAPAKKAKAESAPAKKSKAASTPAKKSKAASTPAKKSKGASAPAKEATTDSGDEA